MKIRTKLAVLFALIVASILLIFSLLVYSSSATYRKEEFRERLQEKALTTARLLFDADEINAKLLKLFDKNKLTTLVHEEVTIYNAKDQIIYDSGTDHFPVTTHVLRQVRSHYEVQLNSGEREMVGLLYNFNRHPYVVVVSAVDKYGNDKLEYLAVVLFTGWAISVAIVIFIGWAFAARALQPISEVVKQVDRITASNLNLRVKAGNGKDEIAQLALIFNKMLARLEEAFLVQKSFVSNASHEIRTPLTAITGQIEVTLLQDRSDEEYKSVLQSVLEDVRNMTQLSNGLLELAQASSDISTISFESVRVDELLWQARSELLKKKPGFLVHITFGEMADDEEVFTMVGNAQLIKTAFGNLMENGCKFSVNGQVDVKLDVLKEEIVIRFTDKGIGIDEKDLPHIFEPFYRSAQSKHINGHGVGLSLTSKIVSLHQGSMHIASKLHQGTTFTIRLPHHFNPSTSFSLPNE